MTVAVQVRQATASDYEMFVTLFAELQTGDTVPALERWLQTMAPGTRFYEADGEVVAYSWATPLVEVGYVRHVVVHPNHRGRGFGRVVMDHLAAQCRAAGCSKWALNVKPDNAPAIALYKGVGMKERYASTALDLDWSAIHSLPKAKRPVTAKVLPPEQDAELEAAFDLARGSLTATRAFAGRVLLRLWEDNEPALDNARSARPSTTEARVGVASFDPMFPGSFPFRVADPTFARTLLEAIRPHANPSDVHVGMVVEDDSALTEMLRKHGARVRLSILHFEGTL